MNRFLLFFKSTSPLILILVSVIIEIFAKFVEKWFLSLSMGLGLISYVLFLYALIKFFNSRFK